MKIILWILGTLMVIVVAAAIEAPGFIKDYIEEHDVELCGREITIGNISINYFTMTPKISDFKMMEKSSKEIFISFETLKLNLEIWHALRNSIYIRDYQLDNLEVRVVQNNANFNFDDLLALADDTTVTTEELDESEPWHFSLDNTKINNAHFFYHSDLNPNVELDSVHLIVPFASDTASIIDILANFVLGSGGEIRLNSRIHPKESNYRVNLQADDLNLVLVENYFYDFCKLGAVGGLFNSNFTFGGSYENTDILNFGGKMSLKQFEMFDIRNEKILGIESTEFSLDTVRMEEGIYNIDFIRTSGFYTIYELHEDGGDNWTNFLDVSGVNPAPLDSSVAEVASTTETELDYSNPFAVLGHYLKEIAQNYNESAYRVGEVRVDNSSFDFVDYTPEEPFRYTFTGMELLADSLNSVEESITFNAAADLNGTGRFDGYIRNYTRDLSDFDLHYEIYGTDLVPFSPYTRYYVDYPILLGEMLYVNDTKIRDGQITSSNVLDCSQFNFGKRVGGKAMYSLPVKLAVSLLKDVKGNIHIDIPVEGNINDPKFKIGKLIWQTVKNLIVKAVTAPFRLLSALFSVDPEELKKIRFALLQFELNNAQTKQLMELAKVTEKKPDLNLDFKRITRKYEEVERYAILASKFRYLYPEESSEPTDLPIEIMEEIDEFDINDSLFISFLNSNVDVEYRESPPQRKCLEFITEERATEQTDQVGAKRNQAIRTYLISQAGVDSTRIRFTVLPNDSLSTNRSNSVYNVDFWVEE